MALSPSVSQLERVNLFILPQQQQQQQQHNPVLMPVDLFKTPIFSQCTSATCKQNEYKHENKRKWSIV